MVARERGQATWRAAVVVLALLVWPADRLSAQTLTVEIVGEVLKIRAPGFSFLQGDPLARLKDGRSVRVELAAMVLPAPGKSPAATTRRSFALSYDLWEERLAVTTTVDTRSRSVSHLMMAAAEAWCVEQLAIPVRALGGLGRDLPLWIRLGTACSMATARRMRKIRATRCRGSSTRSADAARPSHPRIPWRPVHSGCRRAARPRRDEPPS